MMPSTFRTRSLPHLELDMPAWPAEGLSRELAGDEDVGADVRRHDGR